MLIICHGVENVLNLALTVSFIFWIIESLLDGLLFGKLDENAKLLGELLMRFEDGFVVTDWTGFIKTSGKAWEFIVFCWCYVEMDWLTFSWILFKWLSNYFN